ncbi:cytochrome oxidase Cu insertion factor (SCO1/SenC/PrrC family) [Rhodanobacter sp. TND4EL1]
MKAADPAAVRKSRVFLVLIALVFAAPMLVAGLLTWSGWMPGTKGNGEPIMPQRNFVSEKLAVQLADGKLYAWRDSEPRLTLIALAGPDCASHCLATLTSMAAARVTLNRNQSRLRLLYLGTPPADDARDGMRNYWLLGKDVDGKLERFRPTTPDSVSAVLVESNGTALSLYPAGFDPSGLRKDLQKVIK